MRALALLTARQGLGQAPLSGGPMSINISAILGDDTEAARKRAVTEVVDGLRGSQILAIATAVRAMQAEGKEVCNLTVRTSSPASSPCLSGSSKRSRAPSHAARPTTRHRMDCQCSERRLPASTSVTWGWTMARLASSSAPVPAPCSTVPGACSPTPATRPVSFLPAWNVGYYAHLCQTDHHFIGTSPGDQLLPDGGASGGAARHTVDGDEQPAEPHRHRDRQGSAPRHRAGHRR